MSKKDIENLKALRKDIFLSAYISGKGHLASAYSCLEILYALYIKNAMKHNPKNPKDMNRDMLVLSKGHGSLALYSVLCMAGYFDKETLYSFSQPGSILGGEPNKLELESIEASTGSLGHGLSLGIGIAMADKSDGKDNKTIVLLGDGECQEGSIWEGVMSAKHFQLDNLLVILDYNKMQKMDTVESIMSITEWENKWKSFGWIVETVDGHDVDALVTCIKKENKTNSPKVIIAETIKGHGVSMMENNASWHWRLPRKKEMKKITEELGISEEELSICRKHI